MITALVLVSAFMFCCLLIVILIINRKASRYEEVLAFYADEWEVSPESLHEAVPSARLLTDGGDRATEAVGIAGLMDRIGERQ